MLKVTGATVIACKDCLDVRCPPRHIPYLSGTGETSFFLEGMIYNMADDEVKEQLIGIGCALNAEDAVRTFVSAADGEYWAVVKKGPQVLVFNDRWGRLPLYYFINQDTIVASRSLATAVKYVPTAALNRVALVEQLSLGQPLGNKTLVQEIKCLGPGTLVNGKETKCLFPLHFGDNGSRLSKLECLEECRRLLLKSVEARVRPLEIYGYRVVADLSGGSDTRAVCAALEYLGIKVTYCTIGFCGEADIALQIASLYGKSLVATRPIVLEDNWNRAGKMLWATGGTVDYYTTGICYADLLARMEILGGGKIACLGGLGGEFIRHPWSIPSSYRSIPSAIKDGRIVRYLNVQDACAITGMSFPWFMEHLSDHFSAYPEAVQDERMRHLYFEYYLRGINPGEDRSRLETWAIHPFWGKDLFDFSAFHMPRSYISEDFFKKLIESLDKRLMDIPLFRQSKPQRLKQGKPPEVNLSRAIKEQYSLLGSLAQNFDRAAMDSYLAQVRPPYHQRMLMSAILFMQQLENRGDEPG